MLIYIHPVQFINSLIAGTTTGINKIEGIERLETGKKSLLYVAETRAQNRVFENLSESQKLWVTANSGETQSWILLLPLTHMDNALTNYEFRAIFKRRARLPVYTGA